MKLLKVLLLIILLAGSAVSVGANSALMYWQGSESGEVYMLSEDCPVTVSHEKLVFNISQLPDRGYADIQSLNDLDSSVTATYTFYNPALYDVTATLYFPFGSTPVYAPHEGFLSSDLYDVTVDSQPAAKQLRYIYHPGTFEISKALILLKEERIYDSTFNEDTVITRYDYRVDGSEGIYCDLTIAEGKIALISRLNSINYGEGKTRFGVFYNGANGDERYFSVYLLGEDNYIEECHFYQYANRKDEVNNSLVLENKEMMKLTDLMNDLPAVEGMNETDRYNCFITMLRENNENMPVIDLTEAMYQFRYNLICGYVYQMTVPAGASVINEVTAPLYPGIDGYYDPPYHDFTYLSSPAKTWAGFNDLEIEIRTPYYITNFSAGELKKDDDGAYRTHLEGLPEKEITFRACESASPSHVKNTSYNIISWLIFGTMGLALIIPLVLIILIVKLIRKRKKKDH